MRLPALPVALLAVAGVALPSCRVPAASVDPAEVDASGTLHTFGLRRADLVRVAERIAGDVDRALAGEPGEPDQPDQPDEPGVPGSEGAIRVASSVTSGIPLVSRRTLDGALLAELAAAGRARGLTLVVDSPADLPLEHLLELDVRHLGPPTDRDLVVHYRFFRAADRGLEERAAASERLARRAPAAR